MLEKDIQASCMSKLAAWEIRKVIIHSDRYNSGRIGYGKSWIRLAKSGTPDITAYIKYKDICGILFIEVKRPGCKQSPDQLKFMLKFKDISNVWYKVITNPNQIDNLIEEITNYTSVKLDEMDTVFNV